MYWYQYHYLVSWYGHASMYHPIYNSYKYAVQLVCVAHDHNFADHNVINTAQLAILCL